MRSADPPTSSAPPRPLLSGWGLPTAATLAVLAVTAVGIQPRVLPALYLAAVSPVLAATDVIERRLPNRLVLPGFVVAAAGLAGQWAVTDEPPVVGFVSGAAYCGVLLLLSLTGGMGMGDVKLAGVLGIAARLVSVETAAAAPVVAFLLGGTAAVALLVRGGAGTSIPFGPYLLAGFWIALLISPGGSST